MTPSPLAHPPTPAAEAAMGELYELPITVAARMAAIAERNRARNASMPPNESVRRYVDAFGDYCANDRAAGERVLEWMGFICTFHLLTSAMEEFAQGDAGMLAMYRNLRNRGADPAPTAGDDAALLDAWDRYAAGYRVLFALGDSDRDDDDDPDRLAAYAVMDAADDVLLTAPWHTPVGLVKKLQRLLIAESNSRALHRALVMGTPIPDDEVGLIADADRVVWLMLRHAETLAAGMPAPTTAGSAFLRWVRAEEAAAALATRPDDDPDYDAAVAASSAAVRALAAAPVMTGRDIALKLYVVAHVANPPGRDAPHPCALGTLAAAPSPDDTEDAALRKAAARDALNLCPELERLARGDASGFLPG